MISGDNNGEIFSRSQQTAEVNLQAPYGEQREMNLLKNLEVGGLDRAILYGGVNFGSRVQHEKLR
jgi:regulator of RNase E activity RraA